MSFFSAFHSFKPALEPPRGRWGLRRSSVNLKPAHWQRRPSVSASLFQYMPRSSHSKSHHQSSTQPHRRHRHHYHSNPPESSRRSHLNELPPELKLNIFDNLDPVSSTCLGLSSKKLYPLHRSVHKNVGLYEQSQESRVPLAFKLRDWMPDDYVLDWQSEKFVSRERLAELEEKRRRERERYWDERKRLWVWDDEEGDEGKRRRHRSRRH
ncbi:hypothetical protein F5884DRAFT_778338 [Xylogone sp. PMI_703]|nr:hypothetical protein F5884DRAFT_778338 [Xylogone sp. PMI_703]